MILASLGPPGTPLGRLLGRLGGLLGRLGALCGGVLEALGGVLTVLGRSWAPLGGSVGSSGGRLGGLEKRAKTLEGWSCIDFLVGYGNQVGSGKGVKTSQDRPRQAKTGQDSPRQARTRQDKRGKDKTTQAKTGQEKPRQAKKTHLHFHRVFTVRSVIWTPLGPSWARRRGAQNALGSVLAVLDPSAEASGMGGSWRNIGRLGPLSGPSGTPC